MSKSMHGECGEWFIHINTAAERRKCDSKQQQRHTHEKKRSLKYAMGKRRHMRLCITPPPIGIGVFALHAAIATHFVYDHNSGIAERQ